MPKCFVIQPFDSGKYDNRFEDVYRPAIIEAGLEPYRVDQDPGVDVPIDAIEDGIRTAMVCLADISTDNPNVWYELGFAFASCRPVVMVCSDERSGRRYPFDIQHRTVIPYKADSPRDFATLQTAITNRLIALLKRAEALETISETEQVAPTEGLTQPELAVLAAVAGSVLLPDEPVSAYGAKSDVERAGFTAVGFSIGLRRLREKSFVMLKTMTDDQDRPYEGIVLTHHGWDWIERNEHKFIIHRAPKDSTDKSDADIF